MRIFLRSVCIATTICAALLGINSNTAVAQYGLANWFEADLEPVWQAQVDAGRNSGGAAHVFMHVSDEKFTITHELIHNEQSTYFAPEDLNRFGKPIGVDGAAKAADVALRTLEADGLKGRLVTHRVPKITIYAQTSSGILHVIDGETGEMLMTFSNGDPTLTSLAPAANDRYAAVINGSKLYVLDLEEKKAAFERRLSGAPGAGPAMSKDSVYIPLVGGIVESYRLKTDRKFRVPKRFSSAGNTQVRAMVGPDTVSWPTDRGFLYVVDTTLEKVRYRLEARSELISHSTYLPPNRLLAASVEGYVFCFDDSTGRMQWEFSAGESLGQPAVGADHQVFAVSAQSNLFAIDAKIGKEMWKTPGIKQVLSVGKDRVYCLGNRQMVIVDRKEGGILDTVPLSGSERFITNMVTDRIYLASRTGRIVCLRQQGEIWPTLHVGDTAYRASTKLATKEEPAEDPADLAGDDAAPPQTAEAADAMAEDDGDLFGDDDGDDLFGDDKPADDAGGDDGVGDLFGDDSDLFGE